MIKIHEYVVRSFHIIVITTLKKIIMESIVHDIFVHRMRMVVVCSPFQVINQTCDQDEVLMCDLQIYVVASDAFYSYLSI